MSLDRLTLEDVAESFQTKADKAYMNYQDSGEPRYMRTWQKNEDIADAVRAAVSAVDDHDELVRLRGMVARLAGDAQDGEDVNQDLVEEAIAFGIIERRELT